MTLVAERATRAALRVAERERGHSQYELDPVGFVRDVLGEHLWSKQREISESVRDNRHTAVRSAHDTGKSFVASRLAAWWLSVHAAGDAFVVTTAPTFAQVRVILWREIIKAHKKGNLPGRTNQTEWHINEEIVAYGRKPADYDEEAFQGIHARYVLVILDEANGIPKSLWDAVETITTNDGCRVLAIGNPDSPLSQFKRVCDPGTTWNVIHVDGLESPNFTGEDVPDILGELLLSPTWVEERKLDWGEDSPLFQSKVRGNFPKVPEGAVYKELAASQQWFGPLPKFQRFVGGLDFGGANDQAHKTAGVVAGIANDGSTDLARVAIGGSRGVLIRTHHFEHSGPLVLDQLVEWMREVERQLGRRVEWRADKSQFGWINQASKMFLVEPADGGPGSVALGIGLQRRRMQVGSSFFVEELTRPPLFLSGDEVGQEMAGDAWYDRMMNYVWELQPDETKLVKGVPLKRNDDTPDADRYMHEAVDAFPADIRPAISHRDMSGRPLAKRAV